MTKMIEIGSMAQSQSVKSQSNHKDLKDLKEIISGSLWSSAIQTVQTKAATNETNGDSRTRIQYFPLCRGRYPLSVSQSWFLPELTSTGAFYSMAAGLSGHISSCDDGSGFYVMCLCGTIIPAAGTCFAG